MRYERGFSEEAIDEAPAWPAASWQVPAIGSSSDGNCGGQHGIGAVLDELSIGVALVGADRSLLYANRCAQARFLDGQGLRLERGVVEAAALRDTRATQQAIEAAIGGRRRYLMFGVGLVAQSITVVPATAPGGSAAAALVFDRTRQESTLGLYFYARANGLTAAEERLLAALSEGGSVAAAAHEVGCAAATARTHVRSVLSKTSHPSLRTLIGCIGKLPPVAPRVIGVPSSITPRTDCE